MNAPRQIVLVQPYRRWSGHYAKYLGALQTDPSIRVIEPKIGFRRAPAYSALFAVARVWNYGVCVFQAHLQLRPNAVVHFLEVEPFALMLSELLFRLRFRGYKRVFTVHSLQARQPRSRTEALLVTAQRVVFNCLLQILSRDATVVLVFHSDTHLKQYKALARSTTARTCVVRYAGTRPVSVQRSHVNRVRANVLIFGMIRSDKCFTAGLAGVDLRGVSLRIVGKVVDRAVLSAFQNSDFQLVDRYVSEMEIAEHFKWADYAFLPYGPGYTGGAGPVMEACQYGVPVLHAGHPLIDEIVTSHNFGVRVLKDVPLAEQLRNISRATHALWQSNARSFGEEHCWEKLSDKYYALYATS